MNRTTMVAAAFFAFAGCKGTVDSDTGTPNETDDTDVVDTDTGVTFDPASDIRLEWGAGEGDSGAQMTATVDNTDSTGFYLGFAETAAAGEGWYGEDCAPDGCHEFTAMTGSLTYVDAPQDVDNDHTLFNNGTDGTGDVFTSDTHEDRLTYILQLVGGEHDGECYVWGDDPSYYVDEACTVVGQ